jgi:capsular exopolysaccharide synthesis family protein
MVRRLCCTGTDVDCSQAIGVTSCVRGEGVSSVAANLAISAARSIEGPVLLVDANVTQPSIEQTFNVLHQSCGLTDVLYGEADPWECVQESPVEHLRLMSAGVTKPHAAPTYSPDRISELLDAFKHEFRLIVFDLPVANELSTCYALASGLDGVLLVVEAEKVRSHVAQRAVKQLAEARANVLGVVFNKRRDHLPNWLFRTL